MKILAAIDGSDAAFNALRTACNISSKIGSAITAFYVNKGEEYSPDETGWISLSEKISEELESLGHEAINKAYGIGKDFGVAIDGVLSYGIPAAEILKYTDARGIIKLITMGHSSKGKGSQEFVESATKKVITMSKRPVLVTSSQINIRSILIAVDNSAASQKITEFGGRFAKSLDAEVSVISVIPHFEEAVSEYRKIAEVPNLEKYIKDSEETLTQMAEGAVRLAKNTLGSMDVIASSVIRKGLPADEIHSEAKHHDMLLVGIKNSSSNKKLNRIANKLLASHEINTTFAQ